MRSAPRFITVMRMLGVLGVLVTFVMLAAAPVVQAQQSGSDTPTDPFVAAVARVRPSVVAVGTYHRNDTPSVHYFGTGFVVHDGTLIATNAHVVEGVRQKNKLEDLRVYFPDGRDVSGRAAAVVFEDKHHDVALLKIGGPPAVALELDDQPSPAQGTAVGVVGYPIGLKLGLVPAAHKGVIAAVVPSVLPLPRGVKLTPELAEAIRRPYNLFQLDLVVFPGNSGSPLFDAQSGRVIAIINKTLATKTREHLLKEPSGISYAVPIRWVSEAVVRYTATAEPNTTITTPTHDRATTTGD